MRVNVSVRLTMKHFVVAMLSVMSLSMSAPVNAAERPNVLWITSEDNGPHLGCYGDKYADTPHIDRLASRGMIYLNCWSTAPVCAPARTTLILGHAQLAGLFAVGLSV